MLNKLFESLYSKVFVNIVVSRTQTSVYIETQGKKGVSNSAEEIFDTVSLSNKMQEFITSYASETPFFYISILDTSEFQGAAPVCSEHASKFFDVSASKYICYENGWSYYTSKADLYSLEKKYSTIGIDFVFSPFTVLRKFFNDKIDNGIAMYILIEENYISLSVFDNSELLYADHIHVQKNEEMEDLLVDVTPMEDEELGFGGSVDLDNIDVDVDMGELDDFGDIEDLDSFEDMDDFSDVKEEEKVEVEEDSDNSDSDSDSMEVFNEEYEYFLLIQKSINNFYKDDKFKSVFVENTLIADSLNGGNDLKRYLEEEMFLSVIIRKIHLESELCDLAKGELK